MSGDIDLWGKKLKKLCMHTCVVPGANSKGRRPTPFTDKEGSRVTDQQARHVDYLLTFTITIYYWCVSTVY